jgi:capsular exopolysaccharide synthesis family protein
MPLLGQIPAQEDDESSPEDMNKLLIEAPHSILAESFRHLRTNFLFSAPPEHQRTVLVTSCSPEEGKTCIAVNLATCLALADGKVLLVDANFRRPNVPQAFGFTNSREGLSNILVGSKAVDSLILKTPHENLDILPTGPLPPNPSELIGSRYFKDFLQHVKETYQTIIFDGPPLLVVNDALVLAAGVDTVALVVRAQHSSRGAVLRAREQLRRVNAKLCGVILNDVRIARGGYFREMYRTYYEYLSPEALPEPEPEAEEAAAK